MCSLSTLSMPSRALYVAICPPSCRPRGCVLSPHRAAPSPSGHPGCHKLRHLPPPVIHSISHSFSPTSPSVSNQKDPQVSSSPKFKKNTFFLAFSSLAIFLNGIYTSFVSQPLSHALSALKGFLPKQVGHPPGQAFLPISYN